MHKRTKALSISPEVKRRVMERDDGYCVWCGRFGLPEAHYIPRSLSGLGIEENIITLCRECHYRFDMTGDRESMKRYFAIYLRSHYPEWDESKLIYKKGELNA